MDMMTVILTLILTLTLRRRLCGLQLHAWKIWTTWTIQNMGHMGQMAKKWDNMGHILEIWEIWEIWDIWEHCILTLVLISSSLFASSVIQLPRYLKRITCSNGSSFNHNTLAASLS